MIKTPREQALIDSIARVDGEIYRYEGRLGELRRDREGMMRELVKVRVSPIIEGS